ncbi:hypothetical protein Misp01_33440 [Microtetraspora sp. NBRC 13810]|uniref:hypothetical protein n=1 Tax=Microtetraspora sp. NBRC 13810 TaxID=3030990 RepID=UPI0024A10660|nr:hypothetical protein Misp01_33440 [Microtetraspora sp. NBRC 13810]
MSGPPPGYVRHVLGLTTVFVTHDQGEALADRVAVMSGGRTRQIGTPAEIFHRPAGTFVGSAAAT